MCAPSTPSRPPSAVIAASAWGMVWLAYLLAWRCRQCARCSTVSYSLEHDDCSWFASCNISSLGKQFNTGHRTLQVRRGGCGRAFFSRSCGEAAELSVLDYATATARIGAPPRVSTPPAAPGDGLTAELRSFCQV